MQWARSLEFWRYARRLRWKIAMRVMVSKFCLRKRWRVIVFCLCACACVTTLMLAFNRQYDFQIIARNKTYWSRTSKRSQTISLHLLTRADSGTLQSVSAESIESNKCRTNASSGAFTSTSADTNASAITNSYETKKKSYTNTSSTANVTAMTTALFLSTPARKSSRREATNGDGTYLIDNANVDEEKCANLLTNNPSGELEARSVSNTTDEQITDFARKRGCAAVLSLYRFSSNPPSAEERDFPVAYSVLAHENAHQLFQLLSAVYRPHNFYCVHVDRAPRSRSTFEAVRELARCVPNLLTATRRERVVYAAFSRLQADLNCMGDLLLRSGEWKYLINLCGQDFPLRTNLEIIRQLKALKGYNVIPGCDVKDDKTLDRTRFKYKLSTKTTAEGEKEWEITRTKEPHSPPPFNITLKKNLAYNLFTREFLNWTLYESAKARQLLHWSEDTYSPDEHYWGMVNSIPGAPGGVSKATWWSVVRYVLWKNEKKDKNKCHGYFRHGVCVFSRADLPQLTRRYELFVNKLDSRRCDRVAATCLRYWIDCRSGAARSSTTNRCGEVQADVGVLHPYWIT